MKRADYKNYELERRVEEIERKGSVASDTRPDVVDTHKETA